MGRPVQSSSSHNQSNATIAPSAHLDAPKAGNYVSVQLRDDVVLAGFLREGSPRDVVTNRFYIRFEDDRTLIADLHPLSNSNNVENYPENRCFIRIRPNFFVSAYLADDFSAFHQNRSAMRVMVIRGRNLNTPAITHWGVLGHVDGYLPEWAKNPRI